MNLIRRYTDAGTRHALGLPPAPGDPPASPTGIVGTGMVEGGILGAAVGAAAAVGIVLVRRVRPPLDRRRRRGPVPPSPTA